MESERETQVLKMRAVGIERFGGPELLKVLELPIPEPGPGEIRIEIKASGLNPVDYKMRTGGIGIPAGQQFPLVLGGEAAGVVESLGEDVDEFEIGDEVYALCFRSPGAGTYAEYVVAPASCVALKPKRLDFIHAAAVPLAGSTAFQAVCDILQLREGEKFLVTGAAGGVGTFAVQIAKDLGAYVIGIASASDLTYLRDLGVNEVIDYQSGSYPEIVLDRHPEGVDAVLDSLDATLASATLKDGGRLASLIGQKPNTFKEIEFFRIAVEPDRETLDLLAEWIDAGRIRVHVNAVLPLEQAGEAQTMLERQHIRGKVTLKVA
jgi:NADPH:quinone reductase-like Zn-dependent oxidoreductase